MTGRADVSALLRAWAPTALRLGGAGVLGAAIGLGARGVDVATLRATLASMEMPALPALSALPAIAWPALPAWWPVAALLLLGLALALTAASLWRAPAADGAAAADRASLVPMLAASGVARAEIARRTGLSRDAVALSLNLSRQA